MFAIVTFMVTLAVSALGGGGEWSFVDRSPVDMVDGQVVRNPEVSFVGDIGHQRALASVNNAPALPARLPGGSRKEVLDYIVSSNSIAMNVYVGVGVYGEGRNELLTGRASKGFNSYEEFLADVRVGMALVVEAFKTNVIRPDHDVYTTILVIYFNDGKSENRGSPIALSKGNLACKFRDLSLDKAMAVVGWNSKSDAEQVIIPVSSLKSVRVTAHASPGIIAEMTWTDAAKPVLSSNWRDFDLASQTTTPTYLHLSSWLLSGDKRVRINLESASGHTKGYTQFGDDLGVVKLQMTSDTLLVVYPRGASVRIRASSDMMSWDNIALVETDATGGQITLGTPRPQFQFFLGEVTDFD
jgi:hypothetical protein